MSTIERKAVTEAPFTMRDLADAYRLHRAAITTENKLRLERRACILAARLKQFSRDTTDGTVQYFASEAQLIVSNMIQGK